MQTVLLVPGFAGNELRNPDLFGIRGARVWVSPVNLFLGGWERMRLNPSGSGPAPGVFLSLRPGGALREFYNAPADYLRARGQNPVDAVIDWRYRLSQNAVELVRQIRELSGLGQVSIMAHSRGGLVTAFALNLLADAGELDRVRNVVTLGTPWAGSYLPVLYLAGGDRLNRAVSAGLAARLGRSWPLDYRSTPQELFASWPASYELLPDPAAAAANGDPLAAQLYDPASWAATGATVNADRLAEARGLWPERRPMPAGVRWLAVVGDGYGTAGPVASLDNLADPASVPDDLDGDGIVPLWSATRGTRETVTLQLDHRALCTDQTSLGVSWGFLAS